MADKDNLSNLSERVGSRIRKLRKRHGFTVEQLADQTSYTKGYIGNIGRSAVSNPSLRVLHEIANVLCTDVTALLADQACKDDSCSSWEDDFEDLSNVRKMDKRKFRRALFLLKTKFMDDEMPKEKRAKLAEIVIKLAYFSSLNDRR